MSSSAELVVTEIDGTLKIVIPFRRREKFWMGVTYTVMLIFGGMMALLAELTIRRATTNHILWLIPLVVLAVVVLFFILSLMTLTSMPDAVVEYDGKTLGIGNVGSDRRNTWQRKQVKWIGVSRLPMVPIANLVIQTDDNPAIRTGVSHRREMHAAAERLREAMKLKQPQKGKRK